MSRSTDTSDAINPRTRSAVSLNRVVTINSLAAVFAGMILYSVVEFILSPPADASEFLIHHFLHALLIALLVWGILSTLLKNVVVSPVKEIFRHLYQIGSDRVDSSESSLGPVLRKSAPL